MLQVRSNSYTKEDWQYLLYALEAVEAAMICFSQGENACKTCKAKHACLAFEDLKIYVEKRLKEYEFRY